MISKEEHFLHKPFLHQDLDDRHRHPGFSGTRSHDDEPLPVPVLEVLHDPLHALDSFWPVDNGSIDFNGRGCILRLLEPKPSRSPCA